MRRGVISLTKEEIDYILSILPKDIEEYKPLIMMLNLAAKDPDQEKGMQIDEQQIEVILDNLGMPIEGEDPLLPKLREKFQTTLNKL